MTIHHDRGKNVHPVNFSKELHLRFNLPPLHTLTSSYIPKIVTMKLEENKQYYRKLEYTRASQLKYVAMSASVGNFRSDEEKKSHLQLSWVEKINTSPFRSPDVGCQAKLLLCDILAMATFYKSGSFYSICEIVTGRSLNIILCVGG